MRAGVGGGGEEIFFQSQEFLLLMTIADSLLLNQTASGLFL
jgi:hypothetical protein